MTLKIVLFILLMVGVKWMFSARAVHVISAELPIDQAWWNALSDEWKTIFLINQNFSKQGADIYKIQEEYINRMNSEKNELYSEMNTSLRDLFEKRKFLLGYPDFYARALRYKHVIQNDHIDLSTLGNLEMIYMVNGPGDLTPLKKFPDLETLILTDCGISNTIPIKQQVLDLAPLKHLHKLKILHCSSNALHSIEPIKNMVSLKELRLDNSSVTDLSALKNLVNLELLSIGSKVKDASLISWLINLKALYLRGCKKVPDLSNLKKLSRFAIEESEMSIIDASYRVTNIDFLQPLYNIDYLDLENTSYRGTLSEFDSFQKLKAITLPSVTRNSMLEFKKHHDHCVIINAYRYE